MAEIIKLQGQPGSGVRWFQHNPEYSSRLLLAAEYALRNWDGHLGNDVSRAARNEARVSLQEAVDKILEAR
jgi:hypothetical protein